MRNKALLLSMPWANSELPSLQVAALASYARQKGYYAEARHLHLEMAASLGQEVYDDILYYACHHLFTGELFFCSLMFPEKKELVLKYLSRHFFKPKVILKTLQSATQQIYKRIEWHKYSVVGFTITFEQLFSSLLFAKWIKRDFPGIKIVFGGPHVVGKLGEGILNCFPQVDWCVDGEGEIAFTEILRCISRSIENVGDHVPGLIYRKDDAVFINPRRQLATLSGLPDPDYDHYFSLLNSDPLLKKSEVASFLPIESSRGCPHHCAFCSGTAYWNGYRVRPPRDITDQLKRLSERYHINNFRFVDRGVSMDCWKRIASNIERQHIDYNLFYEVRADVKRELLEIMKRAGVREVQVGIEALSTGLLKKMNKETRVIDNMQIMKICEEIGVEHNSNLMLGFPNESKKDLDVAINNIDYACAYRPPMRLTPFRFEQNAPVYSSMRDFGVSKVWNAMPIHMLLASKNAHELPLMVKKFRSRNKRLDYRRLKKRYDYWVEDYDTVATLNRKPLVYYDCRSFLRIEDRRSSYKSRISSADITTAITLSDYPQDLYLFCDSYKSFDEIKKRFPKWDSREIKKVLNKLVKLKVMFREDDDYLSLAIRANGLR